MYTYKAKILRVYDGDGVFDVEVDMGMNLTQRKDIRLYGVDTPEIRGDQHDAGIIVRDYVRKLILDKEVEIHTYHDKTGKYGRLLADIIIKQTSDTLLFIDNELSEFSLGEHLVNIGYAKPYDGGKKDKWTQSELEAIT